MKINDYSQALSHENAKRSHVYRSEMFSLDGVNFVGARVSVGVLSDVESDKRALRFCLSGFVGVGEGVFYSSINDQAVGQITDTIDGSKSLFYRTDFALGKGFSFVKDLTKGNPEAQATVFGVGARTGFQGQFCVDINVRGLLEKIEEFVDHLLRFENDTNPKQSETSSSLHLLEPGKNNFGDIERSLHETMESVREVCQSLREGRDAHFGELSEGGIGE